MDFVRADKQAEVVFCSPASWLLLKNSHWLFFIRSALFLWFISFAEAEEMNIYRRKLNLYCTLLKVSCLTIYLIPNIRYG